ncbi:MAG: hypothetical protein QOK43_2470 [Acidimicrobiaceae bacterium]|nr:hypothetical protein [Acidimicrobiaceae bacterium]
MVLDLLSVAVLGLVGVRLATIARRAATSPQLRARTIEIVRGLRPRHFVLVPLVLTGVVVVAVLAVQVPGLSFGWWTAIGGNGNVIVGSTGRDTGPITRLAPLVFLTVLIPLIPLLAEREERVFRFGAEDWSGWRRARRAVEFGLVHLVMGIPIGVALALSIGGGYFTWAYLRGWRRAGGRQVLGAPEAGLLESTRAHAAYNGTVLSLALVALAFTR